MEWLIHMGYNWLRTPLFRFFTWCWFTKDLYCHMRLFVKLTFEMIWDVVVCEVFFFLKWCNFWILNYRKWHSHSLLKSTNSNLWVHNTHKWECYATIIPIDMSEGHVYVNVVMTHEGVAAQDKHISLPIQPEQFCILWVNAHLSRFFIVSAD